MFLALFPDSFAALAPHPVLVAIKTEGRAVVHSELQINGDPWFINTRLDRSLRSALQYGNGFLSVFGVNGDLALPRVIDVIKYIALQNRIDSQGTFGKPLRILDQLHLSSRRQDAEFVPHGLRYHVRVVVVEAVCEITRIDVDIMRAPIDIVIVAHG